MTPDLRPLSELSTIVAPPDRPGEALLHQAGVPVWQVIFELQQLAWRRDAVAAELRISNDEIEAALAWYCDHLDAVDATILANRRPVAP